MFRLALYVCVLSVCLCSTAWSEEKKNADPFSDYGVLVGISPFGGSVTFSRHVSAQTTWQFSVGGNPEGSFPIEIAETDYELRSHSTWVGCFINHRPIQNAEWFRLVTGLALGNIIHRLEDDAGNRFSVEYKESPVAYMGMGAGVSTRQGFTFGFDIGWLQSAGPRVSFHSGPENGLPGAIGTAEQRKRMDAIEDSFFFGAFLPNIQFGVGYNF